MSLNRRAMTTIKNRAYLIEGCKSLGCEPSVGPNQPLGEVVLSGKDTGVGDVGFAKRGEFYEMVGGRYRALEEFTDFQKKVTMAYGVAQAKAAAGGRPMVATPKVMKAADGRTFTRMVFEVKA